MSFSEAGGLNYYHFKSLDDLGVINGMFTRHGGVSPNPWKSLNLGGTTGDGRDNIIENRKRIFNIVRRNPETIFDVWQVHGTHAICAETPRPLDTEHQKADIILTNRSEITLLMRFADCVPILLCDPVESVVGIVHAGWMGTVNDAVGVAIRTMEEMYASRPGNVVAAIGPAIGPDHYEVGDEVVGAVRARFGEEAEALLSPSGKRKKLDLWRANELLLRKSGVEKIEVAGICTACHTEDWYSHRAERGATGRFGAIIALPN